MSKLDSSKVDLFLCQKKRDQNHEDAWEQVCEQLTTRSRKGLKKLDVHTKQSFLSLTHKEVVSTPGLGTTSWNEIARLQIQLNKSRHPQNGPPVKGATDPLLTEEWESLWESLTARTRKGLKKLGIAGIKDFARLSAERFLSVQGVGMICWKEVKRFQMRLGNEYTGVFSSGDVKDSPLILDDAEEKELLAIVNKELGFRRHILDDLDIRSFDQLMHIAYDDVVINLKGVGKRTWVKLQNAIQTAVALYTAEQERMSSDRVTLADFPLFGGKAKNRDTIPKQFHPDVPTESLTLSSKNRAILKRFNIDTFRSLLMTSPSQLLNEKAFGERSLSSLRQSVQDYLEYHHRMDVMKQDTGESFYEFIHILCRLAGLSKDETSILTGRFNHASGKTATLASLGVTRGRTRQSVSQILLRCPRKIKRDFKATIALRTFQYAVESIFDECRGAVSLDAFGRKIAELMQWNDPVHPKHLGTFIKLFVPPKTFDIKNGIVIICPPDTANSPT